MNTIVDLLLLLQITHQESMIGYRPVVPIQKREEFRVRLRCISTLLSKVPALIS